MAVEHYKECLKYQDELREYVARAYLIFLDEVTHVMIKKEFKVVVPILIELRKCLVP